MSQCRDADLPRPRWLPLALPAVGEQDNSPSPGKWRDGTRTICSAVLCSLKITKDGRVGEMLRG